MCGVSITCLIKVASRSSQKQFKGGSRITEEEPSAKLVVDGKQIPVNQFVQNVFIGIISGVLDSIHGVDEEWKVTELIIKRE